MGSMGRRPVAVITALAPAKINLYLHIVGRRQDGMHLLDSLVTFAALADTVTVQTADGLTLQIDGPFAGDLDAKHNLVLQAARALAQASGRPLRAAIRLTKNIPVAAGLGGGSADAAATLRALMALWQLPGTAVDLPALALGLGADVPACLASQPAFVGGIGEQLARAPVLPQVDLLLVNPRRPLATPDVFRARSGAFSRSARFEAPPRDGAALARLLATRANDLTAPANRCCPEISAVLTALEALPGCRLARMCGSGATCFGLFDHAQAAAAAAALAHTPWWVRASETTDSRSPALTGHPSTIAI